MALRVELDIFSGRSNPVWELGERETVEFKSMIQRALPAGEAVEIPALGYRGFVVHGPETHRIFRGHLFVRESQPGGREASVAIIGTQLESWLLEHGKEHFDTDVYDAVCSALR